LTAYALFVIVRDMTCRDKFKNVAVQIVAAGNGIVAGMAMSLTAMHVTVGPIGTIAAADPSLVLLCAFVAVNVGYSMGRSCYYGTQVTLDSSLGTQTFTGPKRKRQPRPHM
jgi:hypothetical protein